MVPVPGAHATMEPMNCTRRARGWLRHLLAPTQFRQFAPSNGQAKITGEVNRTRCGGTRTYLAEDSGRRAALISFIEGRWNRSKSAGLHRCR